MRILLLEDEPVQRSIATEWIRSGGHDVKAVEDGESAIRAVERDTFDLAVIDWEVPAPSGVEVLQWIRSRGLAIPVIFLTSHGDETEVAAILHSGADDYIVKPARRNVLLARIVAVGRRAGVDGGDAIIEAGAYRIDTVNRTVALNGEPVAMSPREAEVAALLFRKRGRLVSRTEMYETLWGRRDEIDTRTVDTHVSRVRKRLTLDGTYGYRLRAVYQHGYRLEEPQDQR